MATIDSDAHVVETEHTWDYLEPSDMKYRPVIVRPAGESSREYWLIDGKIRGLARQVITAQQFEAISQRAGRRMDTPQATRDMENVQARLDHMDRLGVDIQVLYPTIFIEQVSDNPDIEIALCKAYNRWLADLWRQGGGRLRWICMLPFLAMDVALEELRFAKDHGACGVFMRGFEGPRPVTDPYFFPLYERMAAERLAVGVHVGNGNPWLADAVSKFNGGGSFMRFRVPVFGAFWSIIQAEVPAQFPGLHFHFAEAAAQWIPYLLKDLRRRWSAQGKRLPDYPMKDYNLYVACQTDDDVAYILGYSGEDNLVIGTDYGHNDQSTDIDAVATLREQGAISATQFEKIVYHNPKALFAL
ncbi:MAG: amidohydrolase [Dehalococcoidia bacterium]|nr:amidohydrolase [Dehalococcoidia bacterium]